MIFRCWFAIGLLVLLLLLQSTSLATGVLVSDATKGTYAKVLWSRVQVNVESQVLALA